MYDLHNNIRRKRSISPVAIGTTGTGKTGVIVDTAGFKSVEFEFDYGTITATNATITPTVFHGDTTGAMTSIADADLIGTEALAGIAAILALWLWRQSVVLSTLGGSAAYAAMGIRVDYLVAAAFMSAPGGVLMAKLIMPDNSVMYIGYAGKTDRPYFGNPLAVVVDGDGLDTAEMQRFANWTNYLANNQ